MSNTVTSDLIDSWVLHLRAERKAAQTIKSYTTGVYGLMEWCASQGATPEITRANVNGYVAHMLEAGREPATARARQLGVRRFSAWLTDEGEMAADPLVGIKAPKLDSKVVHPLTDDQIRALIKACAGKDFRDLRDTAIVRLMVETGIRAGECASIFLADYDKLSGTITVRRGKGGKGRVVPFGPQTNIAIDRYIRNGRNGHTLATRPELWLGDRKRGFTYDGLHKALQGRARAAGIDGFHPHLLRHTAAHRWLAAGGSEGGLMAVAGWTRPDMLQRYTKARAADRAAIEARGLNLGDI
ncbi:tyrosine-type recombinase/integrase [Demequina lutea]|uniref:Site-specific recombinase XerD n=1 Tax=Demequina lutea TaxID=431489 RepID=A0A7Y9ZAJ3_9MICO|nr:tyrosine-type recombinase/integrase [Demequina lutea]NYI41240.1 site-specific recombinase XerD [Demequina lutea]